MPKLAQSNSTFDRFRGKKAVWGEYLALLELIIAVALTSHGFLHLVHKIDFDLVRNDTGLVAFGEEKFN